MTTETQMNVRNQMKQQMRKLAAPITQERIGKHTSYKMIGLIYCILNDKLISDEEIMIAVKKVNEVLKRKKVQS